MVWAERLHSLNLIHEQFGKISQSQAYKTINPSFKNKCTLFCQIPYAERLKVVNINNALIWNSIWKILISLDCDIFFNSFHICHMLISMTIKSRNKNVSDDTTLKQFIKRANESMMVKISSEISCHRVGIDLPCWPRTQLGRKNVYMEETRGHKPCSKSSLRYNFRYQNNFRVSGQKKKQTKTICIIYIICNWQFWVKSRMYFI